MLIGMSSSRSLTGQRPARGRSGHPDGPGRRPRWRRPLQWPLVGLGVVSALLMWLTSASGDALKQDRFHAASGVLAERIHHHEELAGRLAFATYALAAVAVIVPLLRGRLPALLLWIGSALLAKGEELAADGGRRVISTYTEHPMRTLEPTDRLVRAQAGTAGLPRESHDVQFALRHGYISLDHFAALMQRTAKSSYGEFLRSVYASFNR